MRLRIDYESKSRTTPKDLSGGFCLFDSEVTITTSLLIPSNSMRDCYLIGALHKIFQPVNGFWYVQAKHI